MVTNGQSTNLSFTKFLFVAADRHDTGAMVKIRNAGANIGRGFFNDYHADGSREAQPQPKETIQFLQVDGVLPARTGLGAARYVVQLSANYRPRLEEVAADFE